MTDSHPYSLSPPDAPTDDARTLVALVATLEDTQRHEDVEGFLSLFDESAVWVTGGGRRLVGLTAIDAFTRAVLPGGMAGGSVNYVVEHVSFFTPDVALTAVRQQYTDHAGKPLDDAAGSPSYVWRRTGGAWKMVAGQNTAVDPT
jgi:uncharacterized protein (TIGR02246 family)